MTTIVLKDAYKANTRDQEKTLTPGQTLDRFHEKLKTLDLAIFERAERIDRGRLDIPVYFSVCGKDAAALTGKKQQMGKGGTPEQAEASAVMELAERFSFYAFADNPENFVTDKHRNLGDRAIPLSEIAKSVHDRTPDLDRALALFADYPQRWCSATDLATGREVLVPFDWFFMINEFNGTSAGNCAEEALLQGVCEVAERHVSARVCRDYMTTPAIDPDSATDPMARELLEKYARAGIVLHLNDFTLDTGIPTVGALAYDPETMGVASEIVWTAGTAPSPEKALCRALTEVAQLAGDFNTGANYVASGLPKFRGIEEADYVLLAEELVGINDLPNLSDPNIRVELERCVAAMANAGMNCYAIETTHPDLGIPAFYTMAPGAMFRERAAASSVALFLARHVTENQPVPIAIAMLTALENALPGRYFLPFYLGTMQTRMRDYDKAVAHFDEALSRDPHPEDEPAILTYKGMALKDQERYDDAAGVLDRALELDPERTDTLNLLGFCKFRLKRHMEAIQVFERLLDIDPSSAIDYANIGSNYREMGDYDQALRFYEHALSLDPSIGFARDSVERIRAMRREE
ncbi:MAG: YcaO-like family protein [Desulfatibacillaceae bacterium]